MSDPLTPQQGDANEPVLRWPPTVEAVPPAEETSWPDGAHGVGRVNSTFSGNVVLGEMNGVKVVNQVQAALEHLDADDAYLDLTLRLFAQPEGFGAAYARWRDDRRLLVLAREPGTGRTTIAHALLATLRQDSAPEVEVGALHFGGGETFPIDRLPAGHRRWAYVVEVPPNEEGFKLHSRNFRLTLTKLEGELRRRESWLIFLISPEQWVSCADETVLPLAGGIGDAEPAEIVRRALTVREPDLDVDRWLATEQIEGLLAQQPPTEVLDIVELIRSAHYAHPDQLAALPDDEESAGHAELTDSGDPWFARRVQTVVEARKNWHKQLLSWHRERERTSLQRSFLLAAAALPATPGAYVYALASKLDSRLRGRKQPPELAALSAPGVIELVDAIQADLSDDDTVVFRHDGWDDAALHYFWTDRPFTRQHFLDWLAEAPTATHRGTFESLTSSQQQDLAGRIARFAVHWATRQQRPEPLATLAAAWHGTAALWRVFVSTLDEAAIQSSTHRYIHTMLLKWATKKDDLPLWRAVAEVCGLEFGKRHTGKALRRLKHVAAVTDPEIEEAVQRSVITLWDDKSVRKTLFEMVVSWCQNPDTASVARRAFGALAAKTDPDEKVSVLLAARGAHAAFVPATADLAAGWTVLLTPPDDDDDDDAVTMTAYQWMDVALRRPDLRDDVLELLRKAVDGPEETGRLSARGRLGLYMHSWRKSGDGSDVGERKDVYFRLDDLVKEDFSRLIKGVGGTGGTDNAA
ncbi:hypothetical protein JNUCC0626_48300 [Lentzea sp. JNUCC 0626]|uniref:hypothetical protein n=1 Tax=Lentzea sp. JNUCC 0626 TaxID=3367513 RepID=UPI0037493339